MARLPIVVQRRRKAARIKQEKKAEKEEQGFAQHYVPKNLPVTTPVSKTQQKKLDRQERFVQERAERKLKRMDERYGTGMGPIKKRLLWMKDLLGF